MTTPIPLFVELCAGTAAVSLRLHRDGARPPVSRQGAKTGYADAILRILGLIPGQRAAAYLWCEPDPGVRLLLHAYRDAGLARAAAAIIRGWAAEDPRALWERLRAEGPPRLPEGAVDAGEVARFIVDTCTSIGHMAGEGGFAATQTGDGSPNNPRGPRKMPNLASVVDRTPTLPATITPDARHIDPREVARWAQITASNRLIHTAWSDTEGRWINTGDGGATFGGAAFCSPPERTAEGFDAAPGDVPALIHPDARTIDPPALPPGTICYMDPSYVGTTGYAHDLPRSEVVALARRWAAAGATVAISEAEPIPELVAEGWFAVEITGERIGQARTFSKQKREWVTLNRPPAWVPPVQGSLF